MLGKNYSYQQNIWTLIKGCHWTHKILREKDNVYTSPQLVDYLFSRDTYLCGTVRTNWKGFPKPLVKSKAEQRRLQRGDFDWLVCWHPFGKIIELYTICLHFLHLRMDSFVRTEKTKAKMGHKTSKPPHRLKSHMLSIWKVYIDWIRWQGSTNKRKVWIENNRG
jgi:hypothetical protein